MSWYQKNQHDSCRTVQRQVRQQGLQQQLYADLQAANALIVQLTATQEQAQADVINLTSRVHALENLLSGIAPGNAVISTSITVVADSSRPG